MIRLIAELAKGATIVINKYRNIYINKPAGIFPRPFAR
jgi:hypothetical protein